jgi:hypothetical protein
MTQTPGAENSTNISNDSLKDNPYIFRIAEAKFEEQPSVPTPKEQPMSERTADEMINLEPTFTQHEAITGIPFSASFYKLDKVYSDIDTQDRLNAKNIDEYILKQVYSKKLDDNAQSIHQYIKDLEKEIELKDYHSPYYKLEKLSKYIKAIQDFGNFNTIKKRLIEDAKSN